MVSEKIEIGRYLKNINHSCKFFQERNILQEGSYIDIRKLVEAFTRFWHLE